VDIAEIPRQLFAEFRLSDVMSTGEAQMLAAIDAYPAEELLNASVDDLVDYFVSQTTIDMVQLHEDEIYVDQTEARADARHLPDRHVIDRGTPVPVPAVRITFFVPYSGTKDLLRSVPSTFGLTRPMAGLGEGMLAFPQTRTNHDATAARRQFDAELNEVRRELAALAADLEPWHESLPKKARMRIGQRRERLLKDRGLVADLGFPIKRRDKPGAHVPPVVRRKPPVRPAPPGNSEPFAPEPALDAAEYDHILKILSDTATALERSPATFARMEEEELRDQFLVPLNSHYEGQATGETFNAAGKTDILVRANGRPVFIAECKIWRGAKSFTAALDQLLSYATWRDTRTAVLLFNKNKNFSAVLAQLRPVVESHPSLKRILAFKHETGLRAVLSHPTDGARDVVVTVLAFDVPDHASSQPAGESGGEVA
jgi:hypothetical protein